MLEVASVTFNVRAKNSLVMVSQPLFISDGYLTLNFY